MCWPGRPMKLRSRKYWLPSMVRSLRFRLNTTTAKGIVFCKKSGSAFHKKCEINSTCTRSPTSSQGRALGTLRGTELLNFSINASGRQVRLVNHPVARTRNAATRLLSDG